MQEIKETLLEQALAKHVGISVEEFRSLQKAMTKVGEVRFAQIRVRGRDQGLSGSSLATYIIEHANAEG